MAEERKRGTGCLVLLVLLLVMVVTLYEPAGHLLAIQARMVFGVAPRHPHWQSPWRRGAQCTIPVEPDVRKTSDDYAWLVRRHARDQGVWLAAAADEEAGGNGVPPYRQQNALRRRYAEGALQLSPNDRAAWATLLAVRLGEHGSLLLKRQSPTAAPERPLSRQDAAPLLYLIRGGEARDHSNAFWPLMRMAVLAQTGDVAGARQALAGVKWLTTYNDFRHDVTERVARAWEPYVVPSLSARSQWLVLGRNLTAIRDALGLLVAHAALLEHQGDAASADALYADVIGLGPLAYLNLGEPAWQLRSAARALPETRLEILTTGLTSSGISPLTREQQDGAFAGLVNDLRQRRRSDLAQAVVNGVREQQVHVRQWRSPREHEGVVYALSASLLWWLQALGMAVGGLALIAAAALDGTARAAKRGWPHWPIAVAVWFTLVLYPLFFTLAFLHAPQYGFPGPPDPPRLLVIAQWLFLCLAPPLGGLSLHRVLTRGLKPEARDRLPGLLASAARQLVTFALFLTVLIMVGALFQAYAYGVADRLLWPQ